ncbi:hypothetical protein [Pseudomonas cichorii]|nr:hypothetical protein [Pseudomonas cichorii]
MTWDQAIAQNNLLFFEADRLNDSAYSLLHEDTLSPEIWASFLVARKQAEDKYAQARQEWLRIKRILNTLECS